jgi:tetratricopeptide (TPR) repeat protein
MNKLWHSLVAFIRNLGYAVRRFYLDLLLQKAHKQIDLGKYHEALKSVKNAQRLRLSDPEVLYTLGLIYYLLDDYGQSIRYFDQTLQINSSHHLAKAWQGWAYRKQGLTIQAEQQFKQVIQVISSTYLDCMAKGIASNGLEQYDESIKYFGEATKYQPKSHQAWNSYAYALHYAGQYENAVDGFCEAIRLFKKYPRAWRGKGLSLSMLEVYEKSLESFEEAIKLKDDFYQAWIGKSISLANMADISSENRQNARYCAKKAIEIKPSYSRTYFLQGLMLSILKENEEAIASYNQAIALQANYPEAYYRKGLALVHLDGRYEEAIKSFEKAVDLQENYTEAYYQIALIYQRLSASQKAIRYYEKIIELQPSYSDVLERYLAGLSILVKLSGFKGTVISSCNKILKLNPQCYELHRIKADALMGLAPYKNAREALRIYDNAIGYGDESAEVWFGKGKAEEQLKFFHKAVISYKKALKIREDYWEAYDNLGWVVLQLSGRDGGLKEALKAWERGLNCLQGNKTEFAKEIRGQLCYSIGRAKHDNRLFLEAKANYNKSIKEYQTIKNFYDNRFIREKHLEVLMDLIRVSRDLKEHLSKNNEQYREYKNTLEIAEKFVDSLIDVTDFPEKKLQLKRKFEGIYQFHVDQYVESGFFKEALELAEERKNVYLRWFYKSNWEEHNNPIDQQFQIQKVANNTDISN